MFVLSWTLLHTIDPSSPVFGQGREDLAASNTMFVLVVSGIDENAVQELRARHTYDASQIRWGHRYADILQADDTGRVHIDYGQFHDVVPEPSKKALVRDAPDEQDGAKAPANDGDATPGRG
jgi:inward rectifier potassium channel